jgi:hypothetical protein
VVSRRNTFFTGQARFRFGVWEPVIGLSYIHSEVSRHATIGSHVYFDDAGSDNGVAIVTGVDAAIPMAPHLFFVPTVRVFGMASGTTDTQAGGLLVRYGAGVRIAF